MIIGLMSKFPSLETVQQQLQNQTVFLTWPNHAMYCPLEQIRIVHFCTTPDDFGLMVPEGSLVIGPYKITCSLVVIVTTSLGDLTRAFCECGVG